MGEQPSSRFLLAIGPWAFYLALFIITWYSERVLFGQAIDNTTKYLILGISWFILEILIIKFGKKCSLKMITFILFACGSILALIWLGTALQLPATDPNSVCNSSSPWVCVVRNPGQYCSSWICQFPGQLIILLILLGIIPPFLVFWQQRVGTAPITLNEMIVGLLIIMILLIGTGLAHYYLYYLSFYCTAAFWLGFAWFIYRDFIHIKEDSNVNEPVKESTLVKIDLIMGLEMLILIAATAVFGISSISLNEILFQSLIEFGCGIAILSAILYTVARIFRSDELGRVRAVQLLELFVFGALIAALANGWYYTNAGIILNSDAGISPIITGLVFGYISIRILLHVDAVPITRFRLVLPIPRITSQSMRIFSMNLALILLFILGMISIQLYYSYAVYIYLGSLLLVIFGLVLSIARMIKGSPQ